MNWSSRPRLRGVAKLCRKRDELPSILSSLQRTVDAQLRWLFSFLFDYFQNFRFNFDSALQWPIWFAHPPSIH